MNTHKLELYLIHNTKNRDAILVLPVIPSDTYCEIQMGVHCGDGFCVVVNDKYIYIVPHYFGKLYCYIDTCIPDLFRGYIIEKEIAIKEYGAIIPSRTYIFSENNKVKTMDTQIVSLSMLDYLYIPILDIIAKSLVILGYTLASFAEEYVEHAPYEYIEPENIYHEVIYHIPEKFQIISIGKDDRVDDRVSKEGLLGTIGALFPYLALFTLINFINTNASSKEILEDNRLAEKTIVFQYNYIVSTLYNEMYYGVYSGRKGKRRLKRLAKHLDKELNEINESLKEIIEDLDI